VIHVIRVYVMWTIGPFARALPEMCFVFAPTS
jgi:hypothetical protein